MKFLTVILSLLTIVLSSYPCCQETDSCFETSTASHCADGDHNTENEQHDKETPCSPFFTCGRCPGFTTNHVSLELVPFELEEKIQPIVYIEPLPKEVYFFSLKPPRIFEV
ncbi:MULTISPECIES: hypothetical protein [Flavobacteriaceae]|uniref:Uncharacterized protein n=1 Tax=Flagellimonas alvinocaridis TaxID=2530200 RepID=A0A4S8S197_9FLAO|nr:MULTISPECIES: hypothetical protein [Allomuricauda]MDC6361802.1 hypothetical protein [Muricauda sp. SP22]THV60964.1 hypothetical protein EZV76_01115 [Allomuricauda alvinocaridis]